MSDDMSNEFSLKGFRTFISLAFTRRLSVRQLKNDNRLPNTSRQSAVHSRCSLRRKVSSSSSDDKQHDQRVLAMKLLFINVAHLQQKGISWSVIKYNTTDELSLHELCVQHTRSNSFISERVMGKNVNLSYAERQKKENIETHCPKPNSASPTKPHVHVV